MKGARRKRAPHTGFADLMTPHDHHPPARGIITTVTRPSQPPPPPPTLHPQSSPSRSPPPPDEQDWGALLKSPPKRRLSPQKPILHTPSNPTPPKPPISSHTTQNPPLEQPPPNSTPAPAQAPPVPAFLSGWDGVDGWGDDNSLDASDDNLDQDPWGQWPDIDSSNPPDTPPSVTHPHPPASLQPTQHLPLQQQRVHHSPAQQHVSDVLQDDDDDWRDLHASEGVDTVDAGSGTAEAGMQPQHVEVDSGLYPVGGASPVETVQGTETLEMEHPVQGAQMRGDGADVGAQDEREHDRQGVMKQEEVGEEAWVEWPAVAVDGGDDRGEEDRLGVGDGWRGVEVEGIGNKEKEGRRDGAADTPVVSLPREAETSLIDESFAVETQQDNGVEDGWGAWREDVEESGGNEGFDAFGPPAAGDATAKGDFVERTESAIRTVAEVSVGLAPAAEQATADLQSYSFYESGFAGNAPHSEPVDNAEGPWGNVDPEDNLVVHGKEERPEQGQGQEPAVAPIIAQEIGMDKRADVREDNNLSPPISTQGLPGSISRPLMENSREMQQQPQMQQQRQMQQQPPQIPDAAFYSFGEPNSTSPKVSKPFDYDRNAKVESVAWGGAEVSAAPAGIPPDERNSVNHSHSNFEAPPPQVSVSVSDSLAQVTPEQISQELQSSNNHVKGLHAGYVMEPSQSKDYYREYERKEAVPPVNEGHEVYGKSLSVDQAHLRTLASDEAYAPKYSESYHGPVAQNKNESELKVEEAFGGGWNAEASGAADPEAGSWNWVDSSYNSRAVSDVAQTFENAHDANQEPAKSKNLRDGAEVGSDALLQNSTPADATVQERTLTSGEGIESKISLPPPGETFLETVPANVRAASNNDFAPSVVHENSDAGTLLQGQSREGSGWIAEWRSTDVDVTSTIAGTDVPSVAGPSSSADEVEWDPEPVEASLPPSGTMYALQSQITTSGIERSQYVDMDANKELNLSRSGYKSTINVEQQTPGTPLEHNTLVPDGAAAELGQEQAYSNDGLDVPEVRKSQNMRDSSIQTSRQEANIALNSNRDQAMQNNANEEQTNRPASTESFSWDSHAYNYQTREDFESSFNVGTGEPPQPEFASFETPAYEQPTEAEAKPRQLASNVAGDFLTYNVTHTSGGNDTIEGLQETGYADRSSKKLHSGEAKEQSHVPMVMTSQEAELGQINETRNPPQPMSVFRPPEYPSQDMSGPKSTSNSTGANRYWSERLRSQPPKEYSHRATTEHSIPQKDARYTAMGSGVSSHGTSSMNESTIPDYVAEPGNCKGTGGGQTRMADSHNGTVQGPGYQDEKNRTERPLYELNTLPSQQETAPDTLNPKGQPMDNRSSFPGSEPFQVGTRANVDTIWGSGSMTGAWECHQPQHGSSQVSAEEKDSNQIPEEAHGARLGENDRTVDETQPDSNTFRNPHDSQNFGNDGDLSAYAPRHRKQENLDNDFSSYAPSAHPNLTNPGDTAPKSQTLHESTAFDESFDTPPVSESSFKAKREPLVDDRSVSSQPRRPHLSELPPQVNHSARNEPPATFATYDASSYSSLVVNETQIDPNSAAPWNQNLQTEGNRILESTQPGEVPGLGTESSFPSQPDNAPTDAAGGPTVRATHEHEMPNTAPSSVGVPSAGSLDHPVGGMVQEQLGVEDFYGNQAFEAYAPRSKVARESETSHQVPNLSAIQSRTQSEGISLENGNFQARSLRSEASSDDRAPIDDNPGNFYEGSIPFPPQPVAPDVSGLPPSGTHGPGGDAPYPPRHFSHTDSGNVSSLTVDNGLHVSGQGIDFYKPSVYEGALDSSMYSYPFSIMDAGPSGGLEHRPPRPVMSWGFGGSLVTAFPGCGVGYTSNIRNDAPGTASHLVRIYNLGSILRNVANDDLVAASEALPPPNLPTSSDDLLPLAGMCERLANRSVGLKADEDEGRSALWRLLALLCKNCTSDWRSQAGSAISGPTSVPMFGRGNSSSFLAGQINKESPLKRASVVSKRTELEQMEAASAVERLFAQGNSSEAIRVAQEAGLWTLALVLASAVNRELYNQAISAFAKSYLNDGSALQTLCFSMAENDAEIIRKATSASGLIEWRKSVGILLTSRRSSMNYGRNGDRFLSLIEQLGDALISQKGDYVAGHVCYLISGRIESLDALQVAMLGGDKKVPAGRPRSYGSPAVTLQSLVFEAIANVLRGESFPHILPFRLILAEAICATGRPDVALKHCESISKSVRSVFEAGRQDIASQVFTPPFLASLESLEQKLRLHLGLQEVSEKRGTLTSLGQSLSAALSRSNLSSRISTAMKTSQGLISKGDDSRAPIPQSSPLSRPATGSYSVPHPSVPPVQTSQGPPALNPVVGTPIPVQRSTANMSATSLPGLSVSSQIADKTSTTNLHGRGAHSRQTSTTEREAPSSNERWNSFVSRTIGVLAPADGDLSPPPPSRSNSGFPMNADPAPSIGLGRGTGTRTPGYDLSTNHMRSASVGDMPMGVMTAPNFRHAQNAPSNVSGTNQSIPSGNARSVSGLDAGNGHRSLNGTTVQEANSINPDEKTLHRRSASDMTMASQTSERKPPRPPRRAPSASVSAIETPDGRVAPKGWSSRFRERLMSAFRGPPRAHMGNENKFVFDRERGRWVIEGEDPEPEDDIPPPPPDDDAMFGGSDAQVPTSVSYDNLREGSMDSHPQQLPRSHSMQDSRFTPDLQMMQGTVMTQSSTQSPYSGSYNTHQSSTQGGAVDNFSSRDNISETSGTSSTGAPMHFMANRSQTSSQAQPAVAQNRFRSQSGRRSGRRAYVDTFNKGQLPSASSGSAGPLARPVMPGMPGLGGKSNSINVFTPSPAQSSGTDFSESGTNQDSGGFGPPYPQGRVDNNVVSAENFMPRPAQGATSAPFEQYSRLAGNPRMGA